MHASIELLLKLSAHLDAVVLKAGKLPEKDDIHPSIREIGMYGADRIALPKKLAELTADRPEAEARFAEKSEAVRLAAHAHKMCAEALRKLGETLAHNEKAAASEPETAPASARTYGIGLALPASRRERVSQLKTDISAKEVEAAGLRRTLKNAKDALRRAKNRLVEIDAAIAETEAKIAANAARLAEVIRLLRKTITHLENRIACRERKRAQRETGPIEVVSAPAEEAAPTGPTDEDIRARAEAEGLAILTADDLEVARQLFA